MLGGSGVIVKLHTHYRAISGKTRHVCERHSRCPPGASVRPPTPIAKSEIERDQGSVSEKSAAHRKPQSTPPPPKSYPDPVRALAALLYHDPPRTTPSDVNSQTLPDMSSAPTQMDRLGFKNNLL